MRYVADGPRRDDWHNLVQRQGMPYVDTISPSTGRAFSYWMEAEHFVFNRSETDVIGEANAALWQAYIEGGERMLAFERAWHGDPTHWERDCYFRKLGIPDFAVEAVIRTWQLDEPDGSPCIAAATEHWPCIYGRYDLSVQLDSFGNIIGVKLLEFNADTPTALVESTLQWNWFEALHKRDDRSQWNNLFDDLVAQWVYELTVYRNKTQSLPQIIHVAYDQTDKEGEDYFTCVLMYETLVEASYKMAEVDNASAFVVKFIPLQDIIREQPEGNPTVPDGPLAGTPIGKFFDAEGMRIKMIFKLDAWEHMLVGKDDYGKTVMHDLCSDDPTVWVEAAYKLVWSNKGFLAVLWEFFKDDPRYNQYLLPTYFQGDPNIPASFTDNCVIKPILSREGADATVIRDGIAVEHGPSKGYGAEGYVVQQLAPLPTFQDPRLGTLHAVIGSWMVGDTGSGICVRVSQNLITDNQSRFAPHYLDMGV